MGPYQVHFGSDGLVSYPGYYLMMVLLLYKDAVSIFYSSSQLAYLLYKYVSILLVEHAAEIRTTF